MKNKRLIIILVVVAGLLAIPLVAMQFTSEVDWSVADFTMMGILLMGTGLLLDLALRKVSDVKYRIGACVAILTIFLLVWAELAVGIFDTPLAGS